MSVETVDPLLLATIGAAAALLGSGIGVGVALWIFRSEREAQRRGELSSALQGLMSALDLLMVEHQRQAPVRRLVGPTAHGDRMGAVEWLAARARARARSVDTFVERYSVAMNRLFAAAPQETLAIVERANSLLADWDADDWEERSDAVRVELVRHLRSINGLEVPVADDDADGTGV